MKTEFMIARILISVETPYDLKIDDGYSLYCVEPQMIKMNEENGLDFVELEKLKGDIDKRGDSVCSQNCCYLKYLQVPRKICDRYEIQMIEDSDFPRSGGRVLYQNEMNLYLETKEGVVQHFFRPPFSRQAMAWCETSGEQSLKIHYMQIAKKYFEDAIGCFNAAAIENILYVYRKFLFHCSYVDVGGEALLFSAHSGGGKTTHALLWERSGYGEMINGDRAVLEKTDEFLNESGKDYKYIVHGLPIAGSSNVFKNRSLPLKAIFLIEKAPINEVVDIPLAQKFLRVFEQFTIHTWDREFVTEATDFAADLVQNVPVRLLRCRPDKEAVEMVKKAIKEL